MKEHPSRDMSSLRVAAVVVLTFATVSAALGEEPEYIFEDVRLTGRQIHAFQDSGENISIVLGEFKLVLGKRILSGRDAVIWIRRAKVGGVDHHDITVYIEGDAKVAEVNGTTTTDRVMLVRLHQAGRIIAAGAMAKRPLKDFPLYKRALRARTAPAAASRPAPRKPPELVVVRQPATAPAEKPPATRPAVPQPTAKSPAPVKPADAQPVSFRADKFTSEVRRGRRITIARGNVYLSQGSPDSDLFLELRSQAAVLLSARGEAATRPVPYAPKIGGVETNLPGPAGTRERITGVYMQGDVVIARGERYLRGPAAYYDFTSNRAIVIDPVFRTIQEQRNIPVYIRADEARLLSMRELWFRNAKVSTSDFYSPSYEVRSSTTYLKDVTPYDERLVRLGEQSWRGRMKHTTFRIRGFPVLYWPALAGDFTEGNTPLRKVQVGRHGRFGFGVETEWHLFRMLGLIRPTGFSGRFELNWYDSGILVGTKVGYARENFTGYSLAYGLMDRRGEDSFGDEREDISAPRERGRLLLRHKQFLPDDWQLQFELSYICDRNFLEEYFPDEFHAGKEQETLLYAKKQRDNWAFTVLLQQRMNRFLTQTESAPDLGFYLIGQPLWEDRLALFSEWRAGMKRYRPAKGSGASDSRMFARLDTRQELDLPLHVKPFNIVPYVVGRLTYWDDQPINGEHCRPYGQIGVRANTHIWRVYNDVTSRLWDLNRLKHIITPEVAVFLADTAGVQPGDLFPMDPDIEHHLPRQSGTSVALYQRLQTKRGRPGQMHTVDWMRLDLVMGIYDVAQNTMPADGRFFGYRPEYSLARNHVNSKYTWNISDSTALLADANYDIDAGDFRRGNIGLAVVRDPRLRYYTGARWIRDLDSSIGTFGFNYKINRKYSVSFFEQYDFEYDSGVNMATSVTFVRKFPRWYAAFTFSYDTTQDVVSLYVTFWPEGIPEVRLGGGRLSLLGTSDMN